MGKASVFSRDRTRRGQAVARVLWADDSRSGRDALRRHVEAEHRFRLVSAGSLADFEHLLATGSFDLVLCELGCWGTHPLQVLAMVRASGLHVPVVIVTARGSERWAVEAMKQGAADYLAKTPGYLKRLSSVLEAVGECRVAAAATNGKASLAVNVDYDQLVGALPVHAAILDQAGTVVAANHAWRHHAFEAPYQSSDHVPGTDYLAACDRAESQLKSVFGDELMPAGANGSARERNVVSSGLRAVATGQVSTFSHEYACDEPGFPRWYKLMAGSVRSGGGLGAIVAHVDITDRKRAEHERDRLFKHSLNLICIVGFDGFMKRWNPAWYAALGYSQDELIKLPLAGLIHPDDLPGVTQGAQAVYQGCEATMEARIRCKDGSYKWTLWNAVPCVEQHVFLATGQDITKRKQAEEQLRESQERFHLIASATDEAIWDWDLRENRLWRNESYQELFGVPDDDRQIIEWWRERIHPDDRQRIMDMMPVPVIDGRQQWVLEYRLRRRDGSYALVYDRGHVICDTAGQPVRMVGSLLDISELKETEARLRESEERFRLAAKATRDAIWDWDLERGTIWRSEGFQSLFGYGPEDIEPRFDWWLDRIHEDDRARVEAQISSLDFVESQACSLQYRFRRADGSYADVIDRGFVMFGSDGKPARMIGTVSDISEQRRAEEAAHVLRTDLAHMARVSTLGEIATGLAHELNQPLTAISNYAESCAQAITGRAQAGDPQVLAWIEKISANTHRAADMIRRLREFSRKSVPCRAPVEINDVVAEVIDLLEAETRLKQVRLLWTPGPAVSMSADRVQIQQVLVNLLRNAYESMAANPPEERKATIAWSAGDSTIEIMVGDQGHGIPAECLDHVFDAFFTGKPEGMGIGLSISRSIVEGHGGRLWVRPNAGRGVTFHFTLPLTGV